MQYSSYRFVYDLVSLNLSNVGQSEALTDCFRIRRIPLEFGGRGALLCTWQAYDHRGIIIHKQEMIPIVMSPGKDARDGTRDGWEEEDGRSTRQKYPVDIYKSSHELSGPVAQQWGIFMFTTLLTSED